MFSEIKFKGEGEGILIQEISIYEREERRGLGIKASLSALVQRESCGGEACRSGRLKLFDPEEDRRKLGLN